VKERRSDSDGAAILAEALERLRKHAWGGGRLCHRHDLSRAGGRRLSGVGLV